jgi:hypothetical protein
MIPTNGYILTGAVNRTIHAFLPNVTRFSAALRHLAATLKSPQTKTFCGAAASGKIRSKPFACAAQAGAMN